MELFRKPLIWMGLYAQSLPDGEDLEQKRELSAVFLAHFSREQSLVILDHVEQGTLGFDVFGREGMMGAHP